MKVNANMAVLFWLNAQKADESGKPPIYCRITLDGKRTQFSTAKKWNQATGPLTQTKFQNAHQMQMK